MTSSSGSPEYEAAVRIVGRGAGLMAGSTVLLFLFSFASRVAFARFYTPTAWGAFNIGLAFTGFLALTALLGFGQSLARSLAFHSDPEERRAIIRYALFVGLAASAVGSLAVLLGAPALAAVFHAPALAAVFQLMAPCVGFAILASILAGIFQGFEDTVPNALFNQVLAPGLFVLGIGVVLVVGLGYLWAIAAYTLSQGLSLGLLAVYAVRHLGDHLPAPSAPARRPRTDLWGLSVAFWGVSSLSFVTAYADTLLLGYFRPGDAVGFYSAGMTLARLLLVAAGALAYTFLPVASRLTRGGDLATLRSTYVTSTRWSLLLTVPMLLLFAGTPALSLRAVFGPEYLAATPSLLILSVAAFVSVAFGPVNVSLAGAGAARPLLLTAVFSASLNTALSLWLIPTEGLLGAAVAWSVARVCYPGLGLYTLYRRQGVHPFGRTLLVPLGVSLAVGLPVFVALSTIHLPFWSVVPLFLAGAALFAGSLVLTRSVEAGDLVAVGLVERLLRRPLPSLRRWLGRYLHEPPR